MLKQPKQKKVPNAKDLPMVIVVWEDAALDPDFDGPVGSVPPTTTVVNRTIGFLVRNTKAEIVTVRDATDADNTVRWPYGIPKRLVKDIIYLEVKSDVIPKTIIDGERQHSTNNNN